jgi:predicted nucleic acid-binding protein
MSVLVDTSVWIEFLRANESCFPVMRRLLEERRVLALECVFGELLQGARDDREAGILVAYWNNLPRVQIDDLFILAGRYSSAHRLSSRGIGLVDSVIILAARHYGAMIWSLDKKLVAVLKRDEVFNKITHYKG